MAGGLRELIDNVFRKDYPDLAVTPTSITLVEAADRVLSPFHPSLSDKRPRRCGRETSTSNSVPVSTMSSPEPSC